MGQGGYNYPQNFNPKNQQQLYENYDEFMDSEQLAEQELQEQQRLIHQQQQMMLQQQQQQHLY
jgi:hypothetical protein